MSLPDIDDIEKSAGSDFISPTGIICNAGLQSVGDTKPHITRGIYSTYYCWPWRAFG